MERSAADPRRVDDPTLRTGAARGQAQRPGGSLDLARAVSAAVGVNVVLDFGVWGKDERSALRALAASVGATSELVYLQVDEEEQWRRVRPRSLSDAATTFGMTKADLERWRRIFQPPDATELEATDIDPPPAGFDSWEAWVAQWWPTSLLGYESPTRRGAGSPR